MTDEELVAIKARSDAATPGPWIDDELDVLSSERDPAHPFKGLLFANDLLGEEGGASNAAFVAHAREDIPLLLAEILAWREIGRVVAKYKPAVVSIYDDDTYSQCPFCDEETELKPAFPGSKWDLVASERDRHTADCPVAKARARLGME